MKNNKKYDRTFKLSLLAVALSSANLAYAKDIACQPGGVDIIGQNGATLRQCDLTHEITELRSGKITVESSQNSVITDSTITVGSDEAKGIFIKNSTVDLNNLTLSVIEPSTYSNIGIDILDNSTVNVNGGNYRGQSDKNASELFRISDNSMLNINNASISVDGELSDAISLEKQSTVNLDNVTINATNGATAIAYDPNQASPSVNIKNANLRSDSDLFNFSWSNSEEDTNSKLTINVNNSTLIAPMLLTAGDSVPDEGILSEKVTLNVENKSQLNGLMTIFGDEKLSSLDVTLNNSVWNVKVGQDPEDDEPVYSTVSNLHLNNGVVNLEKADDFQTLTIKGNLTGSGTFNLNTNIAENKGDKIIVEGTAEGNHKLGVTDHGKAVANKKLTLVETNGGNAAFSLTNPNNRVDLGAYQYFLAKEGNNWVLANSQSAVTPPAVPDVKPDMPITPTNPNVQPEVPTNPTTPANPNVRPETPSTPATPIVPVVPIVPTQPNNPTLPQTALLSNLANAQVSLRQSQLLLLENELSGIHQRLGEVKNGEKGNVWVRNVNSREKLTALSTGDSQTSGFKQNVHSLQVGADASVNNSFHLGGFIGRSQANVYFNGNYGNGKVRSNTIGLYATYLADNGIYSDNIVKYSRLKAESDHTEKRRYHAYTLSSELGKQFKLNSDWIITPQAQLAWTHIQGKDNEDSLSSIYSRVGVRVAKSFTLTNAWNLQPYAEINAITSRNNDSKIHYANAALNVEDSRGRFESVLGINAGVANHRIGLEVSRADGKRYDKPYQIQAVYRYQW